MAGTTLFLLTSLSSVGGAVTTVVAQRPTAATGSPVTPRPATTRSTGTPASRRAILDSELRRLAAHQSDAALRFAPMGGGSLARTGHGLVVHVSGDGSLGTHVATAPSATNWTLTPSGLGRPSASTGLTAGGAVRTSGLTSSVDLGPVQAWYRVTSTGVEQGFAIPQRPTGVGRLHVDLRSSGAVTPWLRTPNSVVLRESDGTTAFVYGGLQVTDAGHRSIPAHFAVDGSRIRIVVDDAGARYPLTIDPYLQQGEFLAHDHVPADDFGESVSMNAAGTSAVVGEPDFSGAVGPGQNTNVGSVYIFDYDTATSNWVQTDQIHSDQSTGTGNQATEVGAAVAMSGDGNTVAVSQSNLAADNTWDVQVDVYKIVGGVWEFSGHAETTNGVVEFAAGLDLESAPVFPVALDGAGNVLAVGDIEPVARTQHYPDHILLNSGTVEVFDLATMSGPDVYDTSETISDPFVDPYTCTGSTCSQSTFTDATFANTIALSSDGHHLLVEEGHDTGGFGMPTTNTTSVYAFDDSGPVAAPWGTTPDLLTGSDVPPTVKGSECATGAQAPAYCQETESFGSGLALSSDGSTAVVGDPGHFFGAGAAYVFEDIGGNSFVQKAELVDSNEVGGAALGANVAVSADGATVAAAAPAFGLPSTGILPQELEGNNPGQVDVFTAPTGGWSGNQNQTQTLVASDGIKGNGFGAGLGLSASGLRVLVGAPNTFALDIPPGAVYSFDLAAPTTTALTATGLPTLPSAGVQTTTGQSITLTATVTPTPTTGGQVAFTEDGTPVAGCTSVSVDPGGTATCAVPAFTTTTVNSGGIPHTFNALFGGTAAFDKSTSDGLDVTVVPPLVITTTSLPHVSASGAIALTLDATGGVGQYTWALDPASTLPGTLQVFSDGEVAGQAPAGTTKFTIDATDQSPSPQAVTQDLILVIDPSTGAGPSITTSTVPGGSVGTTYTTTLAETGGTAPFTWSVAGTLPPGLILHSSTGILSGTPTTPGAYAFDVDLTDAGNDTTAVLLHLTVANTLNVQTLALPQATLNQPYSFPLAAVGGVPGYTWAESASTPLPTGMHLSTAGVVTYTPTTTAQVCLSPVVTDSIGDTASWALCLTVASTLAVVTGPYSDPLPAVDAGASYSAGLVAVGGVGPYSWSITGTATLPPGLTLDPSTGQITGTYTPQAGFIDNNVSVTVTDSATPTPDTAAGSIYVGTYATALSVPATASAGGDVGTPYSSLSFSNLMLPQAQGGSSTYTWSLASGALPPGLTLSAFGALTGTPTLAGSYPFTLQVGDGTGATASEAVTFTVATPPVVTTTALPAGLVGATYSGTLTGTGGTGPYTWTLLPSGIPGLIPPGSGASTFVGKPSTSGVYPVTAQLTDAAGGTATRSLVVTVDGPPGPPVALVASTSATVPDQVTLTWSPPTSDGGSQITSYTVTPYAVTTGVYGTPIVVTANGGAGPATSATFSDLAQGVPYVLYVTATNALGTSASANTGGDWILPVGVAPTAVGHATSTTTGGSTTASTGTPGQPGFISVSGVNGTGTLTVGAYPSNPVPVNPGPGTFYDAKASSGSTFVGSSASVAGGSSQSTQPIVVQVCGVSNGAPVQWWVPATGTFAVVPAQSPPQGGSGCVVITPSVAQLAGTVLFVPAPPATPPGDIWQEATPVDKPIAGTSPVPPSTAFNSFNWLISVSCPTTTFCLAGGDTYSNSGTGRLVTITGGVETDITNVLPSGAGPISSVSCSSSTSCVAMGSDTPSTYDERTARIYTMSGPPDAPSSWSVQAIPAPPVPPPYTVGGVQQVPNGQEQLAVSSLSCVSSTFCVAVGDETSGFNYPGGSDFTYRPVALSLSGTTWSYAVLPDPSVAGLYGPSPAGPIGISNIVQSVSCTAVDSCEAIGQYEIGQTASSNGIYELDEVLTGSGWAYGPTPVNNFPLGGTSYSGLSSISCNGTSASGPTTCMAVGGGALGTATEELLSGGSWANTPPPPTAPGRFWSLDSVSCSSTTECLATGLNPNTAVLGGAVLVWSGGTWSIDTVPVSQGTSGGSAGSPLAVSSPAPGEGVAVGYSPATPETSMVLFSPPDPPTVTSVSPTGGSTTGATVVTIDGTGFTGSTTFDFGTAPATGVTCVSTLECTATVPSAAAVGPVTVTATVGGLTSTTVGAPSYTYSPVVAPPTVAAVTAASGPVGGGTAVTVTGTGFDTTPGATAFTFGVNKSATGATCATTTSCTVTTPRGFPGIVDVVATVGSQSSATSTADRFVFTANILSAPPAPTVSGVAPTTGPTAGGTTVTITGTGFSTTAGATTVAFGTGHAATNVTCTSTTSCTADSPSAAAGTVDVVVTVGAQSSTTSSADQFAYVAPPAPTVSGVAPTTGPTAGGTTVTITGTGFSTTAGATTVAFGTGHAATNVTCTSTTSCTADSPSAAAGTVDVVVTVGAQSSTTSSADQFAYVAPRPPAVNPNGYRMVGMDGGVFDYGVQFGGSLAGKHLHGPIVGFSNDPGPDAYVLVGADGSVYGFGGAPLFGSLAGDTLTSPITAIVTTPDGMGYWLVARSGATYHFGDAPDVGSVGGLNAPVVGAAADQSGHGIWLVGADGGVFALGDAPFGGSLGGATLNAPIVGMAAAAGGRGYVLVAGDGGVFAFDVGFFGSMAAMHLDAPVTGIAETHSGNGYWLTAADGGVFAFGDAPFLGSMVGSPLSGPVVGIHQLGSVPG